jgi:site-specific DNA recombinase
MTRVAVYVRVSTDKQAEEGVSLDAQEARCRAYATLYNLDVVAVVRDVASAKSLARPGLTRMLAMVANGGVDAVLIVKLDRLTRSVRDLGTLVESYFAEGKAALLSVNDQIDTRSAGGRLVLNVLTSVAQWEREAIGERTKAAIAHQKAVGTYSGGRPLAYPAAVVERARALRDGGASVAAVTDALNAEGVRTAKGTPLARAQVYRLLDAA